MAVAVVLLLIGAVLAAQLVTARQDPSLVVPDPASEDAIPDLPVLPTGGPSGP